MEQHHHDHHHEITSLNKAFIIGITLNLAFVVTEFAAGFWYNSLGLLSERYIRRPVIPMGIKKARYWSPC